MKTTLNINIDTAMMMTVAASLSNSELGKLFRAITARMAGEQAEAHLNNSGLRLAFALLGPSIDDSLQRLALNRANGAKGGRPRKNPAPTEPPVPSVTADLPVENQEETPKKSKKEDLPPTPPIEEKIKKNNNITPSPRAREQQCATTTVPVVQEWEELERQMLGEQPWLEQLCMSRRIRAEDMARYIADFIKYLRERDLRETLPHAKAHFVNQLPYIINIYNTNQSNNHENSQKHIADPVARREFERESRRKAVCRTIAGLAASSQQPAVIPF